MTTEQRRHGTSLLWSLAEIPFCPHCRREDHAEVLAFFKAGAEKAGQIHVRLLDLSEQEARKEKAS